VLVLRWFREAAAVHLLARDNGIGVSTRYRYLHEAVTVLADQAPEPPDVLRERPTAGDTHVIPDGTLIHSDRVAATGENRKGRTVNLWCSGKHKTFGGNVQFVSTADGFPLWCSEVSPGGSHDLAAAREHGAVAALCAAAAKGLPCLADKGYCSAGHGIDSPVKNPPGDQVLETDNRCYNNRMVNVVRPGSLVSSTVPPCAATSEWTTASPRPLPPRLRARESSTR
jgi:hypothetical protein